jgi:catechol 2,3-dioxygenase-like lactoylglutathione lyase family enzyme
MIDHTGVVATNYDKSKQFYTKALAPLGYQLMMELPKEVTGGRGVAGFGVPPKPDFWLAQSETPNKPPIHIAFRADTRALVDAFYKAAMAAGGRDNGGPGTAAALPREGTTALSCSIQTATTSKRVATSRSRDRLTFCRVRVVLHLATRVEDHRRQRAG